MAKLPRIPQRIFAGTLAPSNAIAEFGSTVTGTPVYSGDPAVIMSLPAWLSGGLLPSLIQTGGGVNSPAYQELNGILLTITQQLQYLLLQGVAEWNSTDQYFAGQTQSVAGVMYQATGTNTNVNPVGDLTGTWIPLGQVLTGLNICKGKAVFDGRGTIGANCTIYEGFNLTKVVKNATGNYTAFWTNALPTTFYGATGSCGTLPGQTFVAGDDNFLGFGFTGINPTRTTTQTQCFCIQAGGTPVLENSSMITLEVI